MNGHVTASTAEPSDKSLCSGWDAQEQGSNYDAEGSPNGHGLTIKPVVIMCFKSERHKLVCNDSPSCPAQGGHSTQALISKLHCLPRYSGGAAEEFHKAEDLGR